MADSDEGARFEARVGTMLGGKWRLDRLIGIGGMAAVYAASHRNGAEAAIKILHAQYARRADARTRFLREAYIANKAGRGAVTVKDDDVDDEGAPYLVMELLHGEPVDARAKRLGGSLPLREVLWIASQVLETLEHAHEHGIIHRDLKPDNLFWTTEPAVKVLDFGVARLREPSTTETTRTGMVLGTPAFMAPEQAIGSMSEIDARTDLWSMGAILFRLLTGRNVHPEAQTNALVTAATKRASPITTVDPKIPADVASIVDTALQFEREARYATTRAMREAVDDALARVTRERGPAAAAPEPPREDVAPQAPAEQVSAGFATGMSDDDSLALRDLLRVVGDAVLVRSEQGPAAPKAIRTCDVAFRHAARALTDAHIGLFWNVVPEGFVAGGQLVWTAKRPLPASPEKMYAGGVRMLGILPGITKSEFEELVALIAGELLPFADYATFLHSKKLPHLVYRIDPTKPGMPEHVSHSLEPSSGGDVSLMLDALRESDDAALRVTLLSRLERWGEGHEAQIAALLDSASVEVAMGLLRVLHVLETPAAREAIEKAAASAHAFVRMVALSYLDTGARLDTELAATLGGSDPRLRLETLVGIERYKLAGAGAALDAYIRAASFDALPHDERCQALSALGALSPARAEALAIDLLDCVGSMRNASTRAVAAQLLGSIGETRAAREALLAASASGPGEEELEAAATSALGSFDARAKLSGARAKPATDPAAEAPGAPGRTESR